MTEPDTDPLSPEYHYSDNDSLPHHISVSSSHDQIAVHFSSSSTIPLQSLFSELSSLTVPRINLLLSPLPVVAVVENARETNVEDPGHGSSLDERNTSGTFHPQAGSSKIISGEGQPEVIRDMEEEANESVLLDIYKTFCVTN